MDRIGASALCRERRIMSRPRQDGADDALDTNISGQLKHGQTKSQEYSSCQDYLPL